MTAPALVLASASSSRATMLRDAGVAFTATPAGIDEDAMTAVALAAGDPPEGVAVMLAEAKAAAISRTQPGALVLGADSVVVHRGRLLSRATDLGQAHEHLSALRGDTHRLVSAAALVRDGATVWRHSQSATLTMRDFSDEFLDTYLARVGRLVLSSVGCYHLEGLGAQLFATVEGDYFTVLGLPLLPLLEALRSQGVLPE